MDGLRLNKDGLEFQINDFEFVFDSSGNLIARHTDTGNELVFNSDGSLNIDSIVGSSSIDANTLEASNTLIDPSGKSHVGALADLTASDGVLVSEQVPDLAITSTDVVADQTARLNLDAEEGDVAIQTDIDETFILSTNDPTVDGNWKKIQLDVLGAIEDQQILPGQVGSNSNPANAEINDLTVQGTTTGLETIIDVQSESDLPPIDPPQIAFIQDLNEYQKSLFADGFTLDNFSAGQTIPSATSRNSGLDFADGGLKMYESADFPGRITEYTLTEPFDISTATEVQESQAINDRPGDVRVVSDGSFIFVTDTDVDAIERTTLSTPYDVSTASTTQTLSGLSERPQGLSLSPDGTKLYVISDADVIFEYTLSTAFDLNTASLIQTISTQDSNSVSVAISPDGTKLFEGGNFSNAVYESELSTPFDLSTLSFIQSKTVQQGSVESLAFSDVGTQLFVSDPPDSVIAEYTVGEPERFVSISV